jgi:hypothetical protein
MARPGPAEAARVKFSSKDDIDVGYSESCKVRTAANEAWGLLTLGVALLALEIECSSRRMAAYRI